MKITTKCTLAAVAALFVAGTVFAQEDFADSGLYGGLSSVTWGGKAEAYGRLFPRRTDSEYNTHNWDTDNWGEKATYADASLTLNADYSGDYSDFSGKLKFNRMILKDYNEDILQEFTARAYWGNFQFEGGKMKLVWGKGDKVHVLDNFNANDYTDFIVPDYIDRRLAEYMFHVVYNAPHNIRLEGVYTPWMTPDRLASDGMWKPAAVDSLTDYAKEILFRQNTTNNTGKTSDLTAEGLYNISQFDSESLYPNTKKLRYNQAGLRSTFTIGSVDLGASYYYGHYKQPSANLEHLVTYLGTAQGAIQKKAFASYKAKVVSQVKSYVKASSGNATVAAMASNLASMSDDELYQYVYENQTALNTALGTNLTIYSEDQVSATVKKSIEDNGYTVDKAMPTLDYDQVQVFGLEAATIIGPFNTRAEVAYNLTKDIAGDDPWVKNNSIAWEAGFDIDLPISNLNFNIQTTGKYILHKDRIQDGGVKIGSLLGNDIILPTEEYDVDYDKTGKYYRNQIIVDITDSYFHDNVKVDVKGIYQIETKDLMVLPSVSFKLGGDDFTLNLSGLVIWCYDEDSEYYAWRNNDFASIGIKYQF